MQVLLGDSQLYLDKIRRKKTPLRVLRIWHARIGILDRSYTENPEVS